jgi:hypothetical protein
VRREAAIDFTEGGGACERAKDGAALVVFARLARQSKGNEEAHSLVVTDEARHCATVLNDGLLHCTYGTMDGAELRHLARRRAESKYPQEDGD